MSERVFTVNVNAEVVRFFDESSHQTEGAPTIVVLMGGPAAGKTTIRKKQFATGYVVVDAAEVFLNLSRGEFIPFPDGLEQPMELIGSTVARRAIVERRNIVTELIGADHAATVEFIETMKSIGYQLAMHGITCDIEVAMQRSFVRTCTITCRLRGQAPPSTRWLKDTSNSLPRGTSSRLLRRRSGPRPRVSSRGGRSRMAVSA